MFCFAVRFSGRFLTTGDLIEWLLAPLPDLSKLSDAKMLYHTICCVKLGCILTIAAALADDSVSCLLAQDLTNSVPASQSIPLFEQTSDVGILFIDGEYVRSPYVIKASGNVVTVNGLKAIEVADRSRLDQRVSGERRRRREEDSDDDSEQPRSPRRAAEMIAEILDSRRIVVARSDGPIRTVASGGDVVTFCETMLATKPSSKQISEFIRLSGDESQFEAWQTLLAGSRSNAELRDRLQSFQDRILAVEAEGVARKAAQIRMETFSYPLTLAGMLIGVITLGHVLKWTARSIVAEQREDYAPQVTRSVEVALLLMAVMSVIDLVWTILAGQAGEMREVNPLAAGLIESPLQLVALKVVGTGLGCGILYCWRTQKQVQNATWWMCLVCVLLTFRWVVFDSVIS